MKIKKLSVIGLGKLGLCTAACFAKGGYKVIGMDIRKEYLAEIQAGNVPFYEKNLDALLQKTRANFQFTSDFETAVRDSQASFIIVPTPSEENSAFSNQFLFKVLEPLAHILKRKDDYHIVNIVSTVMPGSCQREFIPLLERLSGKKAGKGFGLAYNPEFIAIGSVIDNFLNPDLVLIGESDPVTGQMLQRIYETTCDNTPYIARTSIINAEIAKLSINCFCTMKISFANNLAALCDKTDGADAGQICEILGQDSRIGGKYIKPGLGFGGPCFPRDNEAFIHFISKNGGYAGLQEAVVSINKNQAKRALEKIRNAIGKHGGKVALLGLAYKPDTYLTERSQALEIAVELSSDASVTELRVYDPLAKEKSNWQQTDTLEGCVAGANVAVVLTPLQDFLAYDWHHLLAENSAIINFWD